jgi:hypothetical protein
MILAWRGQHGEELHNYDWRAASDNLVTKPATEGYRWELLASHHDWSLAHMGLAFRRRLVLGWWTKEEDAIQGVQDGDGNRITSRGVMGRHGHMEKLL